MYTLYNLLKFLHIIAAVVWLGGSMAVAILNARLARDGDRTVLSATARQSAYLGRFVFGPAAAASLVTGFVMVAVSGMGGPLWVNWGLGVILLSALLGGTVLRRAGAELGERMATSEAGDPRISVLQRRLARFGTLNLLLLLSAVWAMVFKPTL